MKKSKFSYVIGSLLIGIVSVIICYFVLFLAGAVGNAETHKLIILSSSAEKEYDGTALQCKEYTIKEGELCDGDELDVTFYGSQKEVGSSKNNFAVTITNDGVDVSSYYEIELVFGDITVSKRHLAISTKSEDKFYDGSELVNHNYSIISGFLLDSHILSVKFLNSIVDVGSVSNDINAQVTDDKLNNVTKNYDIIINPGKLEIKPRELTITSSSAEKIYDGLELTSPDYEIVNNMELVDGDVLKVSVSGKILDCGTTENTIKSAYILSRDGEDNSHNYKININSGTLEVKKRDVMLITSSAEKTYDGTPLMSDESYFDSAYSFAEGETPYVELRESITDAGSIDNKASTLIIRNASDKDVTSNYNIKTELGKLTVHKREIILETGSGVKKYDESQLQNETYNLISGNCISGHYLNVAFDTNAVNAGTYKNEITVKVIDGDGKDCTDNYKITVQTGELVIEPLIYRLSTGSDEKYYDGLPLSCNYYDVLYSELPYNYSVDIDFISEIIDAGIVENELSVKVYNGIGKDVTENILITVENGTLLIKKREIIIKSYSESKTYDGTPLVFDSSDVVYVDELLSGHSLSYEVTGSIINAGKVNNTIDNVLVKDINGNDFTRNYNIIKNEGLLTIYKKDITVKTESDEKFYDGLKLERKDYHIYGEPVQGDYVDNVSFTANAISVGEYKNDVDLIIRCYATGEDVSGNYNVKKNLGTLSIKPVIITIKTESDKKIYDATPLICEEYTVINGNLISGHTMDVHFENQITDAGEKKNSIIVVIKDEYGYDATGNYKLNMNFGTLQVLPRPITVISKSDSKFYDGTPLECKQYVLQPSDNLLADHNISVYISGTRTEVGESKNTIADVTIKNSNDEIVTSNYIINKVEGTLSVVLDEMSGISKKPFKPSKVALMSYISNYSGSIYLKNETRSFYRYDSWSYPSIPYDCGDLPLNPMFFTSDAVKNSGVKNRSIKIETLDENLNATPFPYYLDNGPKSSNDYKLDNLFGKNYMLKFLPYDYLSLGKVQISPAYNHIENEYYYNYVLNRYLQIPENTKKAMLKLATENGLDPMQSGIIQNVANYIRNAGIYNMDFKTYPNDADMAVYFLKNAKEGICQHFATSATMMYRALGIPARYATGYAINSTSNKKGVVYSTDAHAWVEVYIKGMGWVNVEVTGSSEGKPEDNSIFVKPLDIHVPLSAGFAKPDGRLQGLRYWEDQGYTYKCTVSGFQDGLGTSLSNITSFSLYDKNNIDVTDNFKLVFYPGVLQVYKSIITVHTKAEKKVYDGLPVYNNDWYFEGELEEGHSIDKKSVKISNSYVDVGKYMNTVSFNIVDESGSIVNGSYFFNNDFSYLEITPRPLVIRSESCTKKYDEKPLTCDKYSVDGLVDGDIIKVRITGRQTNIGYSENTIGSVTITDKVNNNKKFNYKIKKVNGTLTVGI